MKGASKVMGETDRMLITKGKAGLGNRLLAVLGSLMYCKLSGRAMFVDWTDGTYAEDRENAWDYAFVLKAPQAGPDQISGDDVYPQLWRGNLAKSITELIDEFDPDSWDDEMAVYDRYSLRMGDLERPERILLRWSYFDDFANVFRQMGYGWFSQARRRQVLRKILADHVELNADIMAEFDELARLMLTRPTIGVHIRYTDNKAPYELLAAKVDELARENPDAAIFLATDNKKVAGEMSAKYPGRLVSLDKLMSDDGRALHHSFQTKQALKEVLFDMYMLSRCEWLVYSSVSSLGFCASLLSQAQAGNLYDCLRLKARLRGAAKTLWINSRARIGK